jgi:thiol-disulfide isomerase/thioredoxin
VALGTIEGVQRDGLKLGERAVPIEGVTPQGEDIQWFPKPGYSYLLAFVSPNCGPCERILPSIATLNSDVQVILIVAGSRALVTELQIKFRLPSSVICLAEEEERVYEDYRVRVTPFAFMIGEDGRIRAKGLCDTAEKLQALLSAEGHNVPAKLLASASYVLDKE